MPRYVNPADVNWYQSETVANGKLYFFESGTSTPKTTYADVAEATANPHPVLLDAGGREPNIFFSGSAKVRLNTSLDEMVWERDPVGGQSQLGNFSDYNAEIIYNIPDLIRDSNGNFYQSLTNANQDNLPSDDGGVNWKQIDFTNPVWATGATYNKTDITTASDSNRYISITDGNIANNPTSDGGVNWINISVGEVVTQTVSGELTPGGKINQIADSGAFTLPSAAGVPSLTILSVEIQEQHKANTPTLTRDGTDLIRNDTGTDTVINFAGSGFLTLTSNGVDEWSY